MVSWEVSKDQSYWHFVIDCWLVWGPRWIYLVWTVASPQRVLTAQMFYDNAKVRCNLSLYLNKQFNMRLFERSHHDNRVSYLCRRDVRTLCIWEKCLLLRCLRWSYHKSEKYLFFLRLSTMWSIPWAWEVNSLEDIMRLAHWYRFCNGSIRT